MLSVLAGESSAEHGVCFQLYFERFKRLFQLSQNQADTALPQKREPWKYYATADADYSGYQGCFATADEGKRFMGAVAGASD